MLYDLAFEDGELLMIVRLTAFRNPEITTTLILIREKEEKEKPTWIRRLGGA